MREEPARLWGEQTENARELFNVGTDRIPVVLFRSIGQIKEAAAKANVELEILPVEIAASICETCHEIEKGEHDKQIVIGLWQAGCGNQLHTNINEIIANRSAQLSGSLVDPIEHVNLGQSTNDVVPSGMHLALLQLIERHLRPGILELLASYERATAACRGFVKPGRTYLQDAHPLDLGEELRAQAHQVRNGLRQIDQARDRLLQLSLGGTAIGTGLGARAGFGQRVVSQLSMSTGFDLRLADNPVEAVATHDAVAVYSSALALLATSCLKISTDIQILASGPRCGFADVTIPAHEAGSTSMGGKINPTQATLLANVAVRVMANHHGITIAAASGLLQLNTFKPLIADAAIQSTIILGDACRSFGRYCIDGVRPNGPQLLRHRSRAISFISVFRNSIGYAGMAKAVQTALDTDSDLASAIAGHIGVDRQVAEEEIDVASRSRTFNEIGTLA